MILRHLDECRQIELVEEQAQHAPVGSRAVRIARIEQHLAAVLQIRHDLLLPLGREDRQVGGDRPIDQGKESQLVLVGIDADGSRRLDGGARVECEGQADESGLAEIVERRIPGQDIGKARGGGCRDRGGVVTRRGFGSGGVGCGCREGEAGEEDGGSAARRAARAPPAGAPALPASAEEDAQAALAKKEPAQGQADDEIGKGQEHGGGDQPGLHVPLALAAVDRAGDARRQVGKQCQGAHLIAQVEGAPRRLRAIIAGRVARPDAAGVAAPRRRWHSRPRAAVPSSPKPSSVLKGGRLVFSAFPATPWLSATMRWSISTKRPEKGSVRPVGIGRRVRRARASPCRACRRSRAACHRRAAPRSFGRGRA